MAAAARRNPFTSSSAGGRALSAVQLPFFLARPPAAYGVLTTRGRKTGKRRRRCVRAVRDGDRVYLVAIKGSAETGWVKNALVTADVELRLPGGRHRGRARPIRDDERPAALRAYAHTVRPFDYLTYMNWRTGRPTASAIRRLLAGWFDGGYPLVVELSAPRGP
jgi:deazaflavin-dependent oxidoreductase (nitroreductase family)